MSQRSRSTSSTRRVANALAAAMASTSRTPSASPNAGFRSPRKRSKSPSPPAPAVRASMAKGQSKGLAAGKWSSTTVQQSSSKSSARMGRKTTAAQTALKLTRSQLETVIYRWNGVKAFDTNGNYWLNNRVVTAGRRDLPMYIFDLTSVYANPISGGTPVYATPFLQLTQEVATGNMAFQIAPNRFYDGVADATGRWGIEKSPGDPSILTVSLQKAQSKAFLKSLSIKMNCWGAKTKAAQYTIQLVKFLDDELVPSHAGYAADILLQTKKRTDFYQNLIKTLTFNPIAQTGGSYKGRMKVLKSETFTIQPNSLDDGDTDPNVRTVSMFVAMNRIISYQESAVTLSTDVNTSDNASYALNSENQFKPQTRPKSRVYLMIRCSNYKLDTADSNVDTPSFDLMIRSNHQVTV